MSQAILCPQCGKKFSLPPKPPATYTCTQCGTLMDLGAFRPAAAAAATPKAAPAAGAAVPSSSRRPRSRVRGRPAAAARQPAPVPARDKAPVGAIIVVVVLVTALIVIVSTKGDDPARVRTGDAARIESVPSRRTTPDVAPVPAGATRAGDGAAAAAPTRRAPPRRKRDGRPDLRRIDLQTLPWPDEVEAGTRTRVEEAIRAIYVGGRDGVEARDYLVAQGRPIAGRLISEFKSLQESPGFDNREGASMAAAIDGVLRSIDGWTEREMKEREQIRAWGAFAAPSFIEKIAKGWIYWWQHEEWKHNPRKPWDPTVDESDESPDGMRPPPPEDDEEGGGEGASPGEAPPPGYARPAGR